MKKIVMLIAVSVAVTLSSCSQRITLCNTYGKLSNVKHKPHSYMGAYKKGA